MLESSRASCQNTLIAGVLLLIITLLTEWGLVAKVVVSSAAFKVSVREGKDLQLNLFW